MGGALTRTVQVIKNPSELRIGERGHSIVGQPQRFNGSWIGLHFNG